jgi:hypothetical protein
MKIGATRLPNRAQAKVEKSKIYDYLLNTEHPLGHSKAEFFLRFGFNRKNWKVLGHALRAHALAHPVVSMVETTRGRQFVIDGSLQCPDGRYPLVRAVWRIDVGTIAPRLITSYPLGKIL